MNYQTPPPPQQYPPAQQPPAYGPTPQQPSGYGPPQQQPYGMKPPEATSIKSMLNIAGILSLIFGILFILVSVLMLFWYFTFTAVAYPWGYDYGWQFGYMIGFIVLLIFAIINFIIYMQCRKISSMVDQRQYVQAKSKTLIWVIVGFILGAWLTAILLIIAYLKYDNLIRWGQPGQYPPVPQPYSQPQPQYPQPQPYPPTQQQPPYQPPPQNP